MQGVGRPQDKKVIHLWNCGTTNFGYALLLYEILALHKEVCEQIEVDNYIQLKYQDPCICSEI